MNELPPHRHTRFAEFCLNLSNEELVEYINLTNELLQIITFTEYKNTYGRLVLFLEDLREEYFVRFGKHFKN